MAPNQAQAAGGGIVHTISIPEMYLVPEIPCDYKALIQLWMGTPISARSVSTSGCPCAPSPDVSYKREGWTSRQGTRAVGPPSWLQDTFNHSILMCSKKNKPACPHLRYQPLSHFTKMPQQGQLSWKPSREKLRWEWE